LRIEPFGQVLSTVFYGGGGAKPLPVPFRLMPLGQVFRMQLSPFAS
jgi:hypothetical protein